MDQNKIDDVLKPLPQDKALQREEMVREQFWPKFQAFAARLPFAEDVAAAFYCATDSKTPLKVRGTLYAALAYFIMPVDFVPDFLALVGLGDDIAVLTTVFTLVTTHITDEHREKAKAALGTEEAAPEEPS